MRLRVISQDLVTSQDGSSHFLTRVAETSLSSCHPLAAPHRLTFWLQPGTITTQADFTWSHMQSVHPGWIVASFVELLWYKPQPPSFFSLPSFLRNWELAPRLQTVQIASASPPPRFAILGDLGTRAIAQSERHEEFQPAGRRTADHTLLQLSPPSNGPCKGNQSDLYYSEYLCTHARRPAPLFSRRALLTRQPALLRTESNGRADRQRTRMRVILILFDQNQRRLLGFY